MPKDLRAYRAMIRLYPKPYRDQYGEQMVQTLTDVLDDQPNRGARSRAYLKTSFELPIHIIQQNLIFAGGTMQTETPNYVKRNTAIAAALIAPFFIIVFSRTLQHNHLYNSFAWQSSLWMTLIIMPVVAFLISAFTFLKWSRARKVSLWRNLLDIRRSWLIVGVGALALFIALFVPFHDSTHCVAGNPLTELRNFHQTWQCVWQG